MKKYRIQKETWSGNQLVEWENSYFETDDKWLALDIGKVLQKQRKKQSIHFRTKIFEAETGLQIFPHRNEERFLDYVIEVNGKKEIFRGLKLSDAKRHTFAKYPFLQTDRKVDFKITAPTGVSYYLGKDMGNYNQLVRIFN